MNKRHAIKNTKTYIHQAIHAIFTNYYWIVIIILIINRAYNLIKFLSLFYRKSFEKTALNYREVNFVSNIYQALLLKNNSDLHLINLNLFHQLFKINFLSIKDTLIALSQILKKIQLY